MQHSAGVWPTDSSLVFWEKLYKNYQAQTEYKSTKCSRELEEAHRSLVLVNKVLTSFFTKVM